MTYVLCVIVTAAVVNGVTVTADAPCVALRITDGYGRNVSVASGPVRLTAEARVTQDASHRYLRIEWDYAQQDNNLRADRESPNDAEPQDGTIGSEERSLDGAHESIRNDVPMAHLEGGTYEVRATVYVDEARTRSCGSARARVVVR